MKHKRFVIVSLVLLRGGMIFSFAKRQTPPVPANRPFKIFGGSVASLEAVRYGKTHSFLSSSRSAEIQREIMSLPAADNDLILLMRVRGRTREYSTSHFRINIRDDAGGYHRSYPVELTEGRDPEHILIRFGHFPRRGKTLKVAFRGSEQECPVYCTVRFPHPGQQTRPQWTPNTLPTARTQDGLTFVLEKAEYVILRDGTGMPFGLHKPVVRRVPSFDGKGIPTLIPKPKFLPFKR